MEDKRFIEYYTTEYNGEKTEKVLGVWKDAEGSNNIVGFKASWGKHDFSSEEIEILLEGETITFGFTTREGKSSFATGHLQYGINEKGNKYLGFFPDFFKEYVERPVFDPSVGSRYEIDKRNAAKMNEFMRIYYYSKLVNEDGTDVLPEFITDAKEQKKEIDVIYFHNNKKYIIDEKAQMDYIYREKGPLDTFALELLNSASGKKGWFVNDELETEYYMFIWPHSDIPYPDKRLRDVNDIEYARYALVERACLKSKIESQYQSLDVLMEYALGLLEKTLKGTYENNDNNRRYFKKPPFDEEVYLVYTMPPTNGSNENGKVEGPVNLVVPRKFIEEVAEIGGTGMLRRNDNETNGGIN